jgi:transketolase
LARSGEPPCHQGNTQMLRIGRPSVLKEGADAVIITYSSIVHEVLTAVEELEEEEGRSIRVISFHTLKPLKEEWILPLVGDRIPIIVVEEQMPGGSLGSRLALFFKERAIHSPFDHLHLPEEYPNIGGDREFLLDRGRLSKTHLKRRIKESLDKVQDHRKLMNGSDRDRHSG